MSIFSDSVLFATIMSFPDFLRKIKQELYEIQEEAAREALRGHEKDKQAIIHAFIQEIRKNRSAAITYIDKIIIAADSVSDSKSDLSGNQLLDLVYEPVLVESIQKQIPHKAMRVQQLDRAIDYANIRCITYEIGAQDVFDNIEEYQEIYNKGFNQITAMLIQGSVTGKNGDALMGFAESFSRSMIALEYALNYEEPNSRWTGSQISTFFLDSLMKKIIENRMKFGRVCRPKINKKLIIRVGRQNMPPIMPNIA